MSLDKAIAHGKEKRNPYRGVKAVDSQCRNHGDCPWCQGAVKYKLKKRMDKHVEGIAEGFSDPEGQDFFSYGERKKDL